MNFYSEDVTQPVWYLIKFVELKCSVITLKKCQLRIEGTVSLIYRITFLHTFFKDLLYAKKGKRQFCSHM